jgi:hypothetical protein
VIERITVRPTRMFKFAVDLGSLLPDMDVDYHHSRGP